MSAATRRLERRRQAQRKLHELFDRPQQVIVIHYSCESFYDRPDGTSPRITSIAVRNLVSGQSQSFSVHQVAERESVPIEDIPNHYDRLEKQMLAEFYEYVAQHHGYMWLHWNMRNIDYGFQALAHRYKVLGGRPENVDEGSRVNLSNILVDIYGSDYVEHPRLPTLTKINNITDTDFLAGAAEATAFESQEYVKLHRSTLRKVEILAGIAQRAEEGRLQTQATWRELYGWHPQAFAEWLGDHWFFPIFGFLASLASIIGLLLYFLG